MAEPKSFPALERCVKAWNDPELDMEEKDIEQAFAELEKARELLLKSEMSMLPDWGKESPLKWQERVSRELAQAIAACQSGKELAK